MTQIPLGSTVRVPRPSETGIETIEGTVVAWRNGTLSGTPNMMGVHPGLHIGEEMAAIDMFHVARGSLLTRYLIRTAEDELLVGTSGNTRLVQAPSEGNEDCAQRITVGSWVEWHPKTREGISRGRILAPIPAGFTARPILALLGIDITGMQSVDRVLKRPARDHLSYLVEQHQSNGRIALAWPAFDELSHCATAGHRVVRDDLRRRRRQRSLAAA